MQFTTLLVSALLMWQGTAGQAAVGVLTGVLRDSFGRTQADIRVAAMSLEENTGADVLVGISRTDETGRYRMEVPPGKYYVVAGLVDLPTYFPGVEAREKGTVITVAAGAQFESLDFALKRPTARKVLGTVRDDRNRPVDKGVLYLSAPGGPYITTVRADGAFEFPNVRPGPYVLHIDSASWRYVGITVKDEDVRVEMVIPAK